MHLNTETAGTNEIKENVSSEESESDFEHQSSLLPSFSDTEHEEALSTMSGILANESPKPYVRRTGFNYGTLTIPLPAVKSTIRCNPKKRFDFFVSNDRMMDEVTQPLKCWCLYKSYPKYATLIDDRRFVTVERATGCKFAFDDETNPRKILKLLKIKLHRPQKPYSRKFTIFAESSQQLAHGVSVLTQELPSLMSHAVFKSRLLLGFSASNYYPVHGRMIFPNTTTQNRKRTYLSIPNNLIEKEKYFHLKKSKKSTFILTKEETSSIPKLAPVVHLKETPLSLEDSWSQFYVQAGIQNPFLKRKSSFRQQFLEFLAKREELEVTEETTPVSTSKITSITSPSLTTDQQKLTNSSSLIKVSEMSIKSLENEEMFPSIAVEPEECKKELIKSKIFEEDKHTSEELSEIAAKSCFRNSQSQTDSRNLSQLLRLRKLSKIPYISSKPDKSEDGFSDCIPPLKHKLERVHSTKGAMKTLYTSAKKETPQSSTHKNKKFLQTSSVGEFHQSSERKMKLLPKRDLSKTKTDDNQDTNSAEFADAVEDSFRTGVDTEKPPYTKTSSTSPISVAVHINFKQERPHTTSVRFVDDTKSARRPRDFLERRDNAFTRSQSG